jgi:hypothetical protein
MSFRSLSNSLVGVVATLVLPAAGQVTQPQAKPAAAGKNWTPPKTPWGDPDLQGWLTNRSEREPLERPDQFAGRKLEDIQGDELKSFMRGARQQKEDEFKAGTRVPHGGDAENFYSDYESIENGHQAWLVTDPADGKIPPMTQQGKDRAARKTRGGFIQRKPSEPPDSWEDFDLYGRCITRGVPGSMVPTGYGNSYQIVQTPGLVVIRYEMVHEARIIPLNGGPHLPTSMRSYMGDPRGHWEGDTLVVETTNFKDESAYHGANGATLKLTERFRHVAPDQIKWAVTVEDPQTWTKPWTFAMVLTMDDTQPILEYACHEGNYALEDELSGARAEEKKAAEKKK